MPVTLDPTVGGQHANSYVSVAEADAYCNERLYATAWTNVADADVKARALITATARIDEVAMVGRRASATQRLEWPRVWLKRDVWTGHDGWEQYIDPTAVPREVREAVIEYAIVLLAAGADVTAVSAISAYRSLALPGGLKLEFRDDAPRAGDDLPPVVVRKLGAYLQSDTSVRVDRSS